MDEWGQNLWDLMACVRDRQRDNLDRLIARPDAARLSWLKARLRALAED